jgi:hypothetical protein
VGDTFWREQNERERLCSSALERAGVVPRRRSPEGKAALVSASTVTWLHLSDSHFGDERQDLDARPVLRALLRDLEEVQAQYGLAPNFVFFTGDVAFGARPGNPLAQQYDKASAFLHKVLRAFDPVVPLENVFVVPGNHDVDRSAATPDQGTWLDGLVANHGGQAAYHVDEMIRVAGPQWRRFMERLESYKGFLQTSGLLHLLQDEHRLSFAVRRDVAGTQVGIAGLNSAWSCCRDAEKGKLWLGGWQLAQAVEKLAGSPISIVLSHHPTSWLNEVEDAGIAREIGRHFDFHLHGHEHDDWVSASETHVRLGAGACHDGGQRDLAYSFVRLYPHDHRADVYLRRYDRRGGGWIPQVIHGKTSVDGVWRVGGPRLLSRRSSGNTTVVRGGRGGDGDAGETVPESIDIFAYFSPASEIDELDRFIGRASELERGLGALRSHGASLAIFGEAGVGKTSLAMQLARIAAGDHADLIRRAGLERLCPAGFQHPVVYYACQQSDRDVAQVLLSLLNDHRAPFSLGALLDGPKARERLERMGGGALVAQLERMGRADPKAGEVAPATIFQLFSNLAHMLADLYGHALVVVLDEFNVVADKKMFAGLLKEAHYIRFILVGTADDIRVMVQDHGSVPRQFSEGQIHLKRMTEKELALIVRTEEVRSKGAFRYDTSAVNAVVQASRGMPYFTHFLGRYALDEAIKREARSAPQVRRCVLVREEDVESALACRLTGLADLDAQYLGWIRPGEQQAWQREFALKLLVCRQEDDIFRSNVKPVADEQGVTGLVGYLRRLVAIQVLEQTSSSTFRFKDIRFKVFARLRPPIYDDTWRRLKFLQKRLDARDSGWTFPKLAASSSRDSAISSSAKQ